MTSIALEELTSCEGVCLVFEKINTKNEKLDAFELLTAIYAASFFDLRADWRGGARRPKDGPNDWPQESTSRRTR
jgi:hypothetical protein